MRETLTRQMRELEQTLDASLGIFRRPYLPLELRMQVQDSAYIRLWQYDLRDHAHMT